MKVKWISPEKLEIVGKGVFEKEDILDVSESLGAQLLRQKLVIEEKESSEISKPKTVKKNK